MPWSLDWFAAEKLAQAGAQIRRVSWTDHYWVWSEGVWYVVDADGTHTVQTTEYGETDLRALDWTDQPFNANPCAATPAFNTSPMTYGTWGDKYPQVAPPPPGYPSP